MISFAFPPIVRRHPGYTIFGAVFFLAICGTFAYLFVLNQRSLRELEALRKPSNEGQTVATAAPTLTTAALRRATFPNPIYLTAELADHSVSYATIETGTVTDGKLSSTAALRFPDGSVTTAAVIKSGTVKNWKLADGSVSPATVLDQAVTTMKTAGGAMTEVAINDGSVANTEVSTGPIEAVQLASGDVIKGTVVAASSSLVSEDPISGSSDVPGTAPSVTTSMLVNGAVTTPKIADSAVTTKKIADKAIVAAKIATGTITGTQIASDGSVVKSIVGNNIFSVTNNHDGSYSLTLTTSCTNGQVLKSVGGQWQCGADLGYNTPEQIYEFPPVGTAKTMSWDNNVNGGQPHYLLYLGAGQNGVVRNVWTTGFGQFSDWSFLSNYELRVYIGAGDIANVDVPPAANLTLQVPLDLLVGTKYDPTHPANKPLETDILDYSLYANSGNGNRGIILTLHTPMPFQNGILIQLWKKSPAVVDNTLAKYNWVSYEVGDTTFPYASWKLRSSVLQDTYTDQDATVPFLNVPSGAGMLLGVYETMRPIMTATPLQSGDVGQWSYSEGDWMFYPDGANQPSWRTSGGEDLFGPNGYYYIAGLYSGQRWGTTLYNKIAGLQASYRLFTKDPVFWNNGMRGEMQNGFWLESGASGENMLDANILTLYYASQ